MLGRSSSSGSRLRDAYTENIIKCGYRLERVAAIIRRIADGSLIVILICIGSNLESCSVDDRFGKNSPANSLKSQHVSSLTKSWISSCNRLRRSCRVRREFRFRS